MSGGLLRRLRGLRALPLLWLTLVWVLLWGSLTPGDVVNGLLLAVLVQLVLPLPDVTFGGRVRLSGLGRFVLRFSTDLVVSSVQVSWQAVRPGPQDVSAVVAVQLRSDSELVMTLTAESLTLVPGSIVLELDSTSRTLYAHVLSAPDDAAVQAFSDRVLDLEARIIRALGRDVDRALLVAPVPDGRTSA